MRWSWTLADANIVATLVVFGVVLPAVLARSVHSLVIPRNDDWAYRRVLFEFVRTGHYSPVGWGAMTLVGQILWGSPFALLLGSRDWVPAVAGVAGAMIGLVAVYLLARSVVGRVWGVACSLLVLALPGFGVNTSSFMTDVPAFSAEVACLVLGAVALRRAGGGRWACLSASMVAGTWGFAIREFALVAPVAVLVVLAAEDRRRVGRYFVTGACLLGACGAIYAWTAGLPGAQHKPLGLPTLLSVQVLTAGYFTLAFVVSPVLPAAVRRSWDISPVRGALGAAVTTAVGVLLLSVHQPLLIGNYLDQRGAMAGQVLFGYRPKLFPGPVWLLLELVALGAGALMAFVMAAWRPGQGRAWSATPEKGLIEVFTWLSAAGLVGYGLLVRAAIWDRYLWPIALGAALLLAARSQSAGPDRPAHLKRVAEDLKRVAEERRWARLAPAFALAVVVGVVALLVTLNADAYDGARWSAGQDAVKAGFAPQTVDAGFEWVGSHAGGLAKPGRHVVGAPPYETWYDQMFPGFRDCAFVSGSRLDEPSLALVRTVSYDELGFAVPENLYLYAVRGIDCPAWPTGR